MFGIEYVTVIKPRYINVIMCIKCKHPFYSYSPYFHLCNHIISFVQYTTVYITKGGSRTLPPRFEKNYFLFCKF